MTESVSVGSVYVIVVLYISPEGILLHPAMLYHVDAFGSKNWLNGRTGEKIIAQKPLQRENVFAQKKPIKECC